MNVYIKQIKTKQNKKTNQKKQKTNPHALLPNECRYLDLFLYFQSTFHIDITMTE